MLAKGDTSGSPHLDADYGDAFGLHNASPALAVVVTQALCRFGCFDVALAVRERSGFLALSERAFGMRPKRPQTVTLPASSCGAEAG